MTTTNGTIHNRREFLKKFALLSAAGSTLLLTSCESPDPEPIPKYGVLPIFEPSAEDMDHIKLEDSPSDG